MPIHVTETAELRFVQEKTMNRRQMIEDERWTKR